MSIVAELEHKLAALKDKVEGDFKDLVLHIEAAYQHVQASHVEDIVKNAVADSVHNAAIKIDNITNVLQAEAAKVEEVVEKTTTSRRKTTANS